MFFFKRKITQLDEKLIKKVKAGNAEAYGKLYLKYCEKIYRFIFFKVDSQQEAEDLTQEVFTKVLEKLNQFSKGSFQAWLFCIARHLVIDYWRQKNKKESLSLNENIAGEAGQDLVEQIDTKTEVKRCKSKMKQLKQDYQEVLNLRFLNDLSIKETAEILNKKESWVRVTTHRAVKELKRILNE